MDNKPEPWKEAAKHALVVFWTLAGAVAPAPLVPFYFIELIGVIWATVLAVVATVLWLAPAYFLYVRKGK